MTYTLVYDTSVNGRLLIDDFDLVPTTINLLIYKYDTDGNVTDVILFCGGNRWAVVVVDG